MTNKKNTIWSSMKLFLIVLSIMSVIIPVVVSYGITSEKINNLEKQEVIYDENFKELESRLDVLEGIAISTQVILSNMEQDIGEIKRSTNQLNVVLLEHVSE